MIATAPDPCPSAGTGLEAARAAGPTGSADHGGWPDCAPPALDPASFGSPHAWHQRLKVA